jgi:hypothetical protein
MSDLRTLAIENVQKLWSEDRRELSGACEQIVRLETQVQQLEMQVAALKEALASTQNELAMEHVANPSTSKTVAINALESILQNNVRLIANQVLQEVRPEAQAYIERRLSERG